MIGYLSLGVLATGMGATVLTELAASPLVFTYEGTVISVRGKLSLIPKGQTQDDQSKTINVGFTFEDGDKLKIEPDRNMIETCERTPPKCEKATVLINCPAARVIYTLSEGKYLQPCHPPMGTPAIPYPPDENRKGSRPKKDLDHDGLARLNDIEEKIDNLKLDQVMTLYLRAEIYTAWNLTEKSKELEELQHALRQQPKNADSTYLYVFRQGGDLLLSDQQIGPKEVNGKPRTVSASSPRPDQ